MDYSLSDTQQMFQRTAEKFFKETCTITNLRALEAGDQKLFSELYQKMAELGFVGLIIPEEYGGVGGTLLDLAIVVEEAGKANLPLPFTQTIVYGAMPLLKYGTEEQKRQYLPLIAEGKLIFTGAFAETDAHYQYGSLSTETQLKDNAFVINGKKMFVPFADSAHYLLTLAKTAPDSNEYSLLLVPNDTDGIHISAMPSIGTSPINEVDYTDVYVGQSALLGNQSIPLQEVEDIMQMATALQCVETAGILRRALDVTSDYVKERTQFARPIGSFQAVQHRLSDMFSIVEGSKLASFQAVWRLEEGLPAEREVSIAKAWIGKEGPKVLTGAHQLHGGMGLDVDYPLQFCFRNFNAAQLENGTKTFHLEKIARLYGCQAKTETIV